MTNLPSIVCEYTFMLLWTLTVNHIYSHSCCLSILSLRYCLHSSKIYVSVGLTPCSHTLQAHNLYIYISTTYALLYGHHIGYRISRGEHHGKGLPYNPAGCLQHVIHNSMLYIYVVSFEGSNIVNKLWHWQTMILATNIYTLVNGLTMHNTLLSGQAVSTNHLEQPYKLVHTGCSLSLWCNVYGDCGEVEEYGNVDRSHLVWIDRQTDMFEPRRPYVWN